MGKKEKETKKNKNKKKNEESDGEIEGDFDYYDDYEEEEERPKKDAQFDLIMEKIIVLTEMLDKHTSKDNHDKVIAEALQKKIAEMVEKL